MKAAYLTRNAAREARKVINAKAKAAGSKALVKDPIKDSDNLWVFPGLNHGGKLTLKHS